MSIASAVATLLCIECTLTLRHGGLPAHNTICCIHVVVFVAKFVCVWRSVAVVVFQLVASNCFACKRSTSPPGGNQVDGLPPALSWYAEPFWRQNARDLINSLESGVFDLSQAMFELHFGPGLASPAIIWTEKMWTKHF